MEGGDNDRSSDTADEESGSPPSLTSMYAEQAGLAAPTRLAPPSPSSVPKSVSSGVGESEECDVSYRDDPLASKVDSRTEAAAALARSEEIANNEKLGFISESEAGNQGKSGNSFFSSLSKVASSAKALAGRIKNSSTSAASSSSHYNPRAPISVSALSSEQRMMVSSLDLEGDIQSFIDRFIDISESGDGLMGSQVRNAIR